MSRPGVGLGARPRESVRFGVAIAATVVLVLASSLWSTQMLDRLRRSVGHTLEIALRAQRLELALERASADESLILRYPGTAFAREARRALADDTALASGIAADLDAPGSPATGPSVDAEDGADVTGDVRRLEYEVAPILARLATECADPGAPPPATPLEPMLAGPRGLVQAIADRSLARRRTGVRRISAREHATLWAAALATSVLLVLSGITGSRLVGARGRVRSARGRATLQADRLAAAVAGMSDGVALFDPDDRLILANPPLLGLAGIDEGASAGIAYAALLDRLGAEADQAGRGPPAPPASGAPTTGQMRRGGRSFVLNRSRMPDGGHMLWVSDVTRRIEDEAALAQAQKVNLLGRLTGGVAHDFNNLLQALSLDLEAVSDALDAPAPAVREGVESALASVERGMRLTRHLLAYSRRQNPVAAPVDLAALLRRQAELLRRTLGDRVSVVLETQAALWPVLAEVGLLENALLNLGVNARDAMPSGGRLVLAAENLPEDGGRVRITVSDEGIGMTAEQVARATEPFFTTKDEGRGTGLGLAMVRRFAEGSGGAFRLESVPGRGTSAILVLPRAAAGVPDPGPRPAPPPPRGRGELVLLVEDDDRVRVAARRSIEALGYVVVAACDADEAVRAIERDGLRPALLMTDVSMPGRIDAAGLAARARAACPGLPVLFNTGDLDSPRLAAIASAPGHAVLAKPWRLDEMARHLRRLLDAPAP